MAYLYILQNGFGKYYTGITTLEPNERLARHNKGHVFTTRLGRPWDIIYIEEHKTMKDAREREKQIKSWKGGNAFKKFISGCGG